MSFAGALSPAFLALGLALSACASSPPPSAPAPAARARTARIGGKRRLPVVAGAGARRAKEDASAEKKLDPEPQRVLRAKLGEPSVPPSSSPPSAVTALGLANTATSEAEGLSSDGPVVSAVLAEGQRLELSRTIAIGHCLTVVAQGSLGVREVDVFLGTGKPGDPEILAQDEQLGPVAILGGRKGCFRHARSTPLAATIYVLLRRGEGAVLVQSFQGAAPGAPSPEAPSPGKK